MTITIGNKIEIVQKDIQITYNDAELLFHISSKVNVIVAIRVLRLMTDCGLKEGKDFIEQVILKEEWR